MGLGQGARRVVDHAAGMNDRWLFVASLVVFGGFLAVVMRFFGHQHERLIADRKQARDTYQGASVGNLALESNAGRNLNSLVETVVGAAIKAAVKRRSASCPWNDLLTGVRGRDTMNSTEH